MMVVKNNLTLLTKKQKTSFGDWLKETRTAKGIGVRELAAIVNAECSASYISYLERNVYIGKDGNPTRPSESIVEALAAGLEVPVNEARLAAGYTELVSLTSENQILRAFSSLFAGYGLLSEKGKEIAAKQVDSVVRGLMEMEGIRFSDEKRIYKEIEIGNQPVDEDRSGLEPEEFSIDLSHPDPEQRPQEDDDEFQFMTDEELSAIEESDGI